MNYARNFLLILLLLILTGCQDDSRAPISTGDSSSEDSSIPVSVQQLIDRHRPGDEQSLDEIDRAFTDGNQHGLNDSSFDVYSVTYIWGPLHDAPNLDDIVTDWTGTLSVNGVAVVLPVKTISFEHGQDSLVPNDLPHTAGWVSITDHDFDGISFLVFLDRDVIYITPPLLTFESAPITLSLDFGQLVHMTSLYHIDSVNSLAVHARRIWPFDCPSGLVGGQWVKDSVHAQSGHFNGLWMNNYSDPLGTLAGSFWTEPDGHRLFAGTISGIMTAQVIANVEGHWYYDDMRLCPMCGEGHGQFKGSIDFLNDDRSAFLHGSFGDYSLPPTDTVMPFHGIWRTDCLTHHNDNAPNQQ